MNREVTLSGIYDQVGEASDSIQKLEKLSASFDDLKKTSEEKLEKASYNAEFLRIMLNRRVKRGEEGLEEQVTALTGVKTLLEDLETRLAELRSSEEEDQIPTSRL